jgi:hypothetical protein
VALGILSLLAAHLYLHLLRANRVLDSKVRERTTKLQASEEKFRTLFEGASDAIFLMQDDRERPLPDFSGKAAAIVRQSGFHTPVTWQRQTSIAGLPERIRLKATFEGEQKTRICFSALYVQPGDKPLGIAPYSLPSLAAAGLVVCGCGVKP